MLPIYTDTTDDETIHDVWSLTEPDGFPVDFLDMSGDMIAPMTHAECTADTGCICCIDDICHETGICVCALSPL